MQSDIRILQEINVLAYAQASRRFVEFDRQDSKISPIFHR